VVTDDEGLGRLARHLTTTAKLPHPYLFFHDQVGFNYRLPNVNAALACAQLEQLPGFLANKRLVAQAYEAYCAERGLAFVQEPPGTRANHWLNAVRLDSREDRDRLLEYSNGQGIGARPAWALLNTLPAFRHCQCGPLPNAEWLEARLVNLPSSVNPSLDQR
jgi:dTDP-4-amino-4,6-dideoxygalactose transaminase